MSIKEDSSIKTTDIIHDKYIVMKVGKKQFAVIEVPT
jgi:tyrosyl-tRNA synthetase